MTGALVAMALLVGMQIADALPTLVLPPDSGSWVVRIVTTGGYTGRGNGNVTASSEGALLCAAVAGCPDRLADSTRRALSQLVSTFPTDAFSLLPADAVPPQPAAPSLSPTRTCMDCVITTVSVRRRDETGERVATYSWDVTTAASVPEAVRRLSVTIGAAVLR